MSSQHARRAPILLAVLIPLTSGPAGAQSEVASATVADTAIPGANRLFFAPTGRTLPAGVSEAGTYLLLAPYAGHAFHDRFMIAAGTPILPGAIGRYWYVIPKVGVVASPLWNVAGGALVIIADENPLSGSNKAASFLWGVVTFGSPKAAITVVLTSDMGSLTSLPDEGAMIVGAEYQLPLRKDRQGWEVRLIAESYWPFPTVESPRDFSLTFAGLRFGERRVAFEIVGAFRMVDGDFEGFTRYPLFHFSFFF